MRWRPPSTRSADLVGGLIAAMLLGWFASYADGTGDPPTAAMVLVAGAVASFAAGRWLTERPGLEVGTVVASCISGSLIVTFPGLLHAGGAPLGYANSNAALAGLGVVAATGSAIGERHRHAKTAWSLLALFLAAMVVIIGSVAASASLAVAILLVALSALVARSSPAVLGGPIVVLLALAITVAVAHGAGIAQAGQHSDERAQLWASAAQLVENHPARGVGIGGFADHGAISPDPDLRWAHNEYLQLAAEGGVVALVLLLALLGWGYWRLGLASTGSPGQAVLGAAALTLVALHATVDHIAHSAAVPLALATFMGGATARRSHGASR